MNERMDALIEYYNRLLLNGEPIPQWNDISEENRKRIAYFWNLYCNLYDKEKELPKGKSGKAKRAIKIVLALIRKLTYKAKSLPDFIEIKKKKDHEERMIHQKIQAAKTRKKTVELLKPTLK